VVLRGLTEPMCLTTPDERARLLGELGVDVVLTLPFTRELASWSAEEFMQRVGKSLGLRQLWAGSDFALGRNRQGDLPARRGIGERLGYTVRVTEDISAGGERISSSRIRGLVRQGEMEEAHRLLGRPYALEGPVEHGDERGRTLNFPTANLGYDRHKITPTYGVYATWTWTPGPDGPVRRPSVTSIGVRPTFQTKDPAVKVEAYLIDFSGDLYEQVVRVDFLKFLRPELRFDSAQALIDQMVIDTQNAREVLAHAR
jgi:riboflavin kinase / FMN adenylyltransferase